MSDTRIEVLYNRNLGELEALLAGVRRFGDFFVRGVIDRNGLDLAHVTERKGSPHTLVCTKTRRSYELRCAQYRKDRAALATLPALVEQCPQCKPLVERILTSA